MGANSSLVPDRQRHQFRRIVECRGNRRQQLWDSRLVAKRDSIGEADAHGSVKQAKARHGLFSVDLSEAVKFASWGMAPCDPGKRGRVGK
jgi:hypothetical protein